jgi:hypothetical protein
MIIKLENNEKINLKIFNVRNLLLEGNPNIIKNISDKKNNIKDILLGERFFIQKGDFLPILLNNSGTVYHIKNIKLIKKTDKRATYVLSSDSLNKTSHWILPLIGNNEEFFKYDELLLNAYSYCEYDLYETFDNGKNIFLKYKFLPNNDKFYENLRNHPQYIHKNSVHSRHEYLCIFKIPSKYQNDFELLKQGYYSKISEDAKKQILRFHHLKKKGTTYSILYKDKDYQEKLKKYLDLDFDLSELNSKPLKEEETLYKPEKF